MHAITRITPPPKGAFLSSAFASGARKPFEYAPSSQVSRSQRLLASIPRGHDRIHVLRRNLYPSQATAGGPVIPRQEAGDPFGLLIRQRIVFLGNQVDDFTADAVISQLLLLDAQDPKKARIHVVSRKSFTLPRDFTHLLAFRRISSFLLTLLEALSQLAWAFMMPCRCVEQMLALSAWASQLQWGRFSSLQVPMGNVSPCQMRES